MAAGLCAAWPFRKSWLEEQDALIIEALAAPVAQRPTQPALVTTPLPPQGERSPAQTSLPLDSAPAVPGLHPLTALDRGMSRRSLVRVDQAPPLPTLAADFSTAPIGSSVDPRAAVVGSDSSSETSEPAPPRHQRRYRILKHDSLESIAERLLGSRQHADKLLAANPEVILAPEVLPVGATIVIPDLSLPAETVVRLSDNPM
jgi:hypothetical protein